MADAITKRFVAFKRGNGSHNENKVFVLSFCNYGYKKVDVKRKVMLEVEFIATMPRKKIVAAVNRESRDRREMLRRFPLAIVVVMNLRRRAKKYFGCLLTPNQRALASVRQVKEQHNLVDTRQMVAYAGVNLSYSSQFFSIEFYFPSTCEI